MQQLCRLCECSEWGAGKCWGDTAVGQKPNLGDQDTRIPFIFKMTSNSRQIPKRTDEFVCLWQTQDPETRPQWASPSSPCLYRAMQVQSTLCL